MVCDINNKYIKTFINWTQNGHELRIEFILLNNNNRKTET